MNYQHCDSNMLSQLFQQQLAFQSQPPSQPYVVYVLMDIPINNYTQPYYVPVLFNSPQYPIISYEYGIQPQVPSQVPLYTMPSYTMPSYSSHFRSHAYRPYHYRKN
jgi:hypothetical protein